MDYALVSTAEVMSHTRYRNCNPIVFRHNTVLYISVFLHYAVWFKTYHI